MGPCPGLNPGIAGLRTGDPVLVHGHLRVRSYPSRQTSSFTGEAQLRHSPTITAAMIGASLRCADALVTRSDC